MLEPLVEKDLATTQPILDRLRNGLHELALLSREGERDEELLGNRAFCHGARLPGILLRALILRQRTAIFKAYPVSRVSWSLRP